MFCRQNLFRAAGQRLPLSELPVKYHTFGRTVAVENREMRNPRTFDKVT